MSGGSTRVPLVSDAVEAVSDSVNYVTQGQLGSDISNLGTNISNEANRAGQNASKNWQRVGENMGLLFKGNFNNVGQSFLDSALTLGTGGMIDPGTQRNIVGETSVDRVRREGDEKAQDQAAAEVVVQTQELTRQNASTVSGLVAPYAIAPGRRITRLSGSTRPAGSLLTLR